ncbi:DUF1549 domain-containing protein [Prosthecobacter sp.]|uniref:DUF1549 domain-containing protein n=1 Tax=Prosthecobacter sp. TaxID=1965333 RepID=UPI001D7ED16C|nr:DUF1549 domain-containing protein [Prosthecobacter sp.]MCB1276910.1 DUF1549 domain-containing protein [Prosthecobacter sp.]
MRFVLLSLLGFPILSVRAAVDFSHQIVPILREHCAECHAGEKKKGGFSFNDRTSLMEGGEDGPVVIAGKSGESAMIQAILSKDPDDQMPPKGKRVPAEQIALLKAWIDSGITWEEEFAFKKPAYEPPLKPRSPALPAAVDGRTHPIDRILDAYLAAKKQLRPAAIDDSTFLRRVYLDLIGLLPTPEEVAAFEKDQAADKRTRLVEALLARDIDYTEHWLTFWNDLLRNDYGGTGFITGGRKQISNWLYHALITNKPFDQFVRELIAPPNDESRGFIDGIKWRGDVSAGQTVEIQFAQSVSQSFLGINMKCASCHDSFIDRWKLSEAYGLAAIYSTRPLEISRCDKPIGEQAVASWLFPEIGQVDAKAAQPERLKQLAALMTHPQNGRTTRTIVNRLWQRLMGRGIVHPVDAMQTEPWSSDLLDYLATYLSENGYDLKKTLAHIATSQAYQSHAQVVTKGADDHGYVYAGPRAKRLTAEQFVDAIWQLTDAAPTKMDASVLRGKVDPALAKTITVKGQWIWSDNPKPAAGETITLRKTIKLDADPTSASAVVTCDNGYTLYVNNKKISEGDDWTKLAAVPLQTALRKGANSIIAIAKNAGNGPNAAGFFFDARVRDNDGKHTEIFSDDTWEWSAKIPGGKEGRMAAFDPKDWKKATVVKTLAVWQKTIDAQAPALLAQGAAASGKMIRASLIKANFLMRTLGRPNRDQIVTERPNELSTLEAIDLANGSILAGTIAQGAKRLLETAKGDFITPLYRHALSRGPTSAELATAKEIVGAKPTQQGLEDLLWAVCMLPEFQVVR